MRRSLVHACAAALLLMAASCGGPRSAPTSVEPSCRVTLPQKAARAADPGPLPAFSAPRSTLVVQAELLLASVKQALESKVLRRVAEERDHDIGVAGRLEYTVDRGPFAVTAQGDQLVVEAPLKAHAQACAKGRCYAGCDPEARVSAKVPLQLGADYKFRPSAVHIEVTRGCELRALGGLVRVDVTPMLQARLGQETKRIEASIDRELPDLRPQAERLWAELSRPRALPLGACVVIAPEAIVQGPASGSGELARLRFGLLAHPELRLRCGDLGNAAVRPLPPLRDDGALPDAGDLHLGVVLPPEAAAGALGGAPEPIDLGRGRARIRSASGTASGLVLDLLGEACGSVGVRAAGAQWTEDGRAVRLTGVTPLAGDADRLSSVGLDAAGLAKGIERAPILVPLAAEELKLALPELARSLSDQRVAVSASVTDAWPEAAGLRGPEIVAVVRVRGAVTMRAK